MVRHIWWPVKVVADKTGRPQIPCPQSMHCCGHKHTMVHLYDNRHFVHSDTNSFNSLWFSEIGQISKISWMLFVCSSPTSRSSNTSSSNWDVVSSWPGGRFSSKYNRQTINFLWTASTLSGCFSFILNRSEIRPGRDLLMNCDGHEHDVFLRHHVTPQGHPRLLGQGRKVVNIDVVVKCLTQINVRHLFIIFMNTVYKWKITGEGEICWWREKPTICSLSTGSWA